MPEVITTAGEYLKDVWPAGTFNSASAFAHFWNQGYEDTVQPPPYSKIMIFKRGIKPVWEDPYNKNGGKFVIRISSVQNALAIFLSMTLRLVFGLLGDTEEFCGSVLASKGSYAWLQLWNRNTNSREHNAKTKDLLRQLYGKKNVYQVHKVNIRFQKLRKQNPDLSDIRTLLKKSHNVNKPDWDSHSTNTSELSTPVTTPRSSVDVPRVPVVRSVEAHQPPLPAAEVPEIARATPVVPVPDSTRDLEKKVQEILDSMTATPSLPELTSSDFPASVLSAPVVTVAPIPAPPAVVITSGIPVATSLGHPMAETGRLDTTNMLLSVLILLVSLALVQDFVRRYL